MKEKMPPGRNTSWKECLLEKMSPVGLYSHQSKYFTPEYLLFSLFLYPNGRPKNNRGILYA